MINGGFAIGRIEMAPALIVPQSYFGETELRITATYIYHTFLSTGTLTPIPGRVLPSTVDSFLVAGGGAGMSFTGGGGGGGEIKTAIGITAPIIAASVTRGERGTYPEIGGTKTGGDSVFEGTTALGGWTGLLSGGGVLGTGGTSGSGLVGGAKSSANAGGGAGNNGVGGDATVSVSGAGGPGADNDWRTGSLIGYGGGGSGGKNGSSSYGATTHGGRSWPQRFDPEEYTGGGGGGAPTGQVGAGRGSYGIVIVRYLRTD